MAKRSNEGAFPSDDFDLQLENQSGEKLMFNSDTDRRFFLFLLTFMTCNLMLVENECSGTFKVPSNRFPRVFGKVTNILKFG